MVITVIRDEPQGLQIEHAELADKNGGIIITTLERKPELQRRYRNARVVTEEEFNGAAKRNNVKFRTVSKTT